MEPIATPGRVAYALELNAMMYGRWYIYWEFTDFRYEAWEHRGGSQQTLQL